MGEQPRVGRRDIAAGGSVALSLLVAYVVVPEPIVQYGAWLVIFTIWMVWFVWTGVGWLSEDDTQD